MTERIPISAADAEDSTPSPAPLTADELWARLSPEARARISKSLSESMCESVDVLIAEGRARLMRAVEAGVTPGEEASDDVAHPAA